MKKYLLGLVIFGMTTFSAPSQAHLAGFIGWLYPGGGFAGIAGVYLGNYNLTRSTEALYGLFGSQRVYGRLGSGCYNGPQGANRGNGQSYDGNYWYAQNNCQFQGGAF